MSRVFFWGAAIQVILLVLCVVTTRATRRLQGSHEELRLIKSCNSSSPGFLACLICISAKATNSKQSLKRLRGGDIIHGNSSSISDAFNSIYSKRTWGNSGGGSGDGSKDLCGVTTQEILRQILFKYNIASLVDAPCGKQNIFTISYLLYLI